MNKFDILKKQIFIFRQIIVEQEKENENLRKENNKLKRQIERLKQKVKEND